jgi:hypothetical protein
MRAFALALLIASTLAAGCTMPGAPDDATRLETGAGERARADAAPAAPREPAAEPAAQGAKPGASTPGAGQSEEPAPPMSDPLPPERLPDAAAALSPDRSCRTAADCAVKNVGNCCGAMPACVNKDARTDPAAVQAECTRKGMSSICGFKPVESCECVAGTCTDRIAAFE